MVLESIIDPKNAEDKPLHVFVVSAVYTLVAAFVSQWIFPSNASILAIAFITILFVPFFQRLFEIEERKEDIAARQKGGENVFSRHRKIIYVFGAFFLGVIIAMTAIYIFVPSENLFAMQTNTLKNFATGKIVDNEDFSRFFINNTQVMLALFVMSLAFGSGAVFILAWNASVIAVYLGIFINNFALQGVGTTVAFLYGVPLGLGTIALHGIPEIVAYFIAGLAGGVLSVGILRENIRSKEFRKIFLDSLLLLLIAEFMISIAAYLEAAF